jgi:hypothetical protein
VVDLPQQAIAAALTAYLGKDGVNKLLGPTATYLGDNLKDWVEQRHRAFQKVLEKASLLLSEEELNRAGSVPPRVLKEMIEEASFCSDSTMLEYFAGVLASSRSGISRDDRGARMSKIVAGMTSYQVRAHFVIYSALKLAHSNAGKRFSTQDERDALCVHIEFQSFINGMAFAPQEMADVGSILDHTMHGLAQQGLIMDRWVYSSTGDLVIQTFPKAPLLPGFAISPTVLGVELFLWAFGAGRKDSDFLFDAAFDPKIDGVRLSSSGIAGFPRH